MPQTQSSDVPGGTLGFEVLRRPAGARVVVAVREFLPRMPWRLYCALQVPLHERTAYGFLRRLARTSSPRPRRRPQPSAILAGIDRAARSKSSERAYFS